uniref:Uncharacterized protein n=1 Tax=Schistocephalus solidus TaxID=70667 RepID=A0A0X3PSG8_SCHSO
MDIRRLFRGNNYSRMCNQSCTVGAHQKLRWVIDYGPRRRSYIMSDVRNLDNSYSLNQPLHEIPFLLSGFIKPLKKKTVKAFDRLNCKLSSRSTRAGTTQKTARWGSLCTQKSRG